MLHLGNDVHILALACHTVSRPVCRRTRESISPSVHANRPMTGSCLKMPAARRGETASGDDDSSGIGGLLRQSFIGTFEVPVSKLGLTTLGRCLRQAGVDRISQSLEDDGWLTSSMPIVTLVNSTEDNMINKNNAQALCYRTLDGNRRVEALRRRDTAREVDTTISVHVHRNMDDYAERILADREY